jgi:hypothetical protein
MGDNVETIRTKIKGKIPAENLLMVVIFLIVSIALLWKCRYGYISADEAFYPTVAYRFLMGDRILYDDWGGAQLYSVLLMPLLKLHMTVAGSMDGVYLYIRYVYTIIKIIISALIYIRLKKYSKIGAYISAMMFLMFAPYGLMVLSYNSVSIGGAVVATLLFLNDTDCIKTRIYWVLSGIALAVSVLGIPYNAIIYIAYVIAVTVISNVYKRRVAKGKEVNGTIKLCYSYKALGFVTLGAALSAALFFAYVFSKTTISEMVQTVPHIFLGDPTHLPKSLKKLTVTYIGGLLTGNNRDRLVFATFLIMAVIVAVWFADKKRQERAAGYVAAVGAASLLMLAAYMYQEHHINVIIYVPNVVAVVLLIIVKDELIRTLFAAIVAPGIVVTYAEYVASDTWFWGIAAASSVATVGSVMIIALVIKRYIIEIKKSPDSQLVMRSTVGLLSAFLVVCACFLMYYRMAFTFRDGNTGSLNVKINEGVAKGVITTQQNYDAYEDVYRDTEKIRNMPSNTNVVYFGDNTLLLAGTQSCATYATYMQTVRTDMLSLYYNEHPDKKADVIYIQGKSREQLRDELVEKYGCSVEDVPTGWILYVGSK